MSKSREKLLINYLYSCVNRIDHLSQDEFLEEEKDLRSSGYIKLWDVVGYRATTHTIGKLVDLQLAQEASRWGRDEVIQNKIGPYMFTAPGFDPIRAVAVWRKPVDLPRVSSDLEVE